MKATAIKPGMVLAGFGEVTEVHISHRDIANTKENRKKYGIVEKPSQKRMPKFINALVRARLAAEAVEQCYIQVPSLVTIHNHKKTIKVAPGKQLELEADVIPELRKAA
jgi:hypothetical protein